MRMKPSTASNHAWCLIINLIWIIPCHQQKSFKRIIKEQSCEIVKIILKNLSAAESKQKSISSRISLESEDVVGMKIWNQSIRFKRATFNRSFPSRSEVFFLTKKQLVEASSKSRRNLIKTWIYCTSLSLHIDPILLKIKWLMKFLFELVDR